MVEIDPFRHLASSDRQQDSASSVVAGLLPLGQLSVRKGWPASYTHSPIVFERRTRLDRVGRLDKDELVLEDLVQDSLRSELVLVSDSDRDPSPQFLRLTISFQADTILSMYKYDGKKATTPSGTALQYSTRSVPKLRTTAGSFRTSNRDEISTWSEPRVTTCAHLHSGKLCKLSIEKDHASRTKGKKQSRVRVMT